MMNNTGEEFTTSAINIGLAVATLLLNTGFVLKAIQLCEECFILLSNGDLGNESAVTKLYHQRILSLKAKAWSTVYNSTSFEKQVREQLLFYQDSDDHVIKGWLNLSLARILHITKRFLEAEGFYDVAKNIFKTTGNARRESECYENLGSLFKLLGQYNQARENLEKAIAINIEIADRNAESSCYVSLGTLFRSLGQYDKA